MPSPGALLHDAPFAFPAEPERVDVLSKYFRALGDPVRLRILHLLIEHGERNVSQLVAALGLPQPKVSNHLACLRWCGFVTTRREHRTIHYRIADERVEQVVRLANGLLDDNAEHVAACCVIDAKPKGQPS